MSQNQLLNCFREMRSSLFAPVNNLFWFLITHSAAIVCAIMLPLLFLLARGES